MLIKQNDNKEDFKSYYGELWENKTKQNCIILLLLWPVPLCLLMMDYLLWRLDLKGVTLQKLHNNLAKRYLNKY